MEWLLFTTRVWLKYYDIRTSIFRFLFCSSGFHKIRCENKQTLIKSKEEMIESNYVDCRYCNTFFFPTIKDKENYLRMKEQDKQFWANYLKMPRLAKLKIKTKKFSEK